MPSRHGLYAPITSNGFVCLRCLLRGYSPLPSSLLSPYRPLDSQKTLEVHRYHPSKTFSTSRNALVSAKPNSRSSGPKTGSKGKKSTQQDGLSQTEIKQKKQKPKKPRRRNRARPLVRRVPVKTYHGRTAITKDRRKSRPTHIRGSQAGLPQNLNISDGVRASPTSTGPSTATWLRNVQKKLPRGRTLEEDNICFEPHKLNFAVVDAQVAPAPRLAFGLERVLFNPGVYHLRDKHSRVYNFDPWLEKVPNIKTFDFQTLNPFTPPSQDGMLVDVTKTEKKKYFGSTSSMTGMLKQFHFLLSNYRRVNLEDISRATAIPKDATFTKITTAPDAVFLRRRSDGIYAIDADKMYDNPNVLSLMGTYMETFFTTTKEQFSRHLHGSRNPIKDEERSGHDSFHYSTLGDMVMRSQLDAHDPRLPGAGIFDLKTRAVLPIRMQAANYEWGMNYELIQQHGDYYSYEREFLDMCRTTLLKYSLQVRMGRMDGIFVAFHNIARVFGFQYFPLNQIDKILHGQEDPVLGDQEFKASLKLVNDVFNMATERFPDSNLRLHFDSVTRRTCLRIFVEPVTDEEIKTIQEKNKNLIEEFEASVLGLKDLQDTSSKDSESENEKPGSNDSKVLTRDAQVDAAGPVHPASSRESHQSTTDDGGNTLEDFSESWQNLESFFAGTKGSSELRDSTIGFELDDLDTLRPVKKIKTPPADSANKRVKSEDPALKKRQKEILGLKLYAASTVNGFIVDRPENLKKNDVWQIFSKIEVMSSADAKEAYEETLLRRQARFDNISLQTGEETDDAFISLLKAKAAESKRWREDRDRLDEKGGHNANKRMWNDELYHEDEDQMTSEELVELKQDMEFLLNPARLVLHGRNELASSNRLRQEAHNVLQRLKPKKNIKTKQADQ